MGRTGDFTKFNNVWCFATINNRLEKSISPKKMDCTDITISAEVSIQRKSKK